VSIEDSTNDVVTALEALHARIDREAEQLTARHADRMQCRRGCSACCLDELTVTGIEAERIRRHHAEWLEQAEPHPAGACAFLDAEGACRVYADRPAVCRTQGLPLRVLFENEEDEIVERRDICPLNLDDGPALGELEEDECWLIGPVELELARLDERFQGDDGPRIALRSLFQRSGS